MYDQPIPGTPPKEPEPGGHLLPPRSALAACLALALCLGGKATGATLVVSNCNDSGPGSLREAVEDLAVGGDTVDLGQLACGTITLTNGAITHTLSSLNLVGPGAERLVIDGNGSGGGTEPVFQSLSSTTSLSLNGLTIANAKHLGVDVTGGCIDIRGDLVLNHSVVTGCTLDNTSLDGAFPARGGGVYVMGELTVKYSTISNNTVLSSGSGGYGGGIYVKDDLVLAKYSSISGNSASGGDDDFGRGGGLVAKGDVTISTSAILDNHATTFAGAMALEGGAGTSAAITNSTISGNSSGGILGGVFVNLPLTLENSTLAYNTAAKYSVGPDSFAAGLFANTFPVEIQSSILADNMADTQAADLQLGGPATVTGANNLIFAPGSAAVPADTLSGQNPQLAPLAWNSGSTLSHLPAVGSPVIDAGNNVAGLAKDQRGAGFPRVVGADADIGAVELDPDRIFHNGFD